MALFFFVVGLEIKRELSVGELASRERALLPVFGALGGMLAPAGVFLLLQPGGSAATGVEKTCRLRRMRLTPCVASGVRLPLRPQQRVAGEQCDHVRVEVVTGLEPHLA